MITDADIKKMKAVFATKDDLKSFATKEDLKSFATKEDLKSFATKGDLKSLDKRLDQMDKKFDNLANNQQRNTEELVELITSGFNAYEKRISHIETEVFNAN